MTNSKTCLFVLYSQNYAARVLPILFNTPKKSLLKSTYPKKILAKFLCPNKSRNRKFQTQKNSFDHPCHLKSLLPPGALAPVGTHEIVRKKTTKKMCMNGYFIPHSALIFSVNICIFLHISH